MLGNDSEMHSMCLNMELMMRVSSTSHPSGNRVDGLPLEPVREHCGASSMLEVFQTMHHILTTQFQHLCVSLW